MAPTLSTSRWSKERRKSGQDASNRDASKGAKSLTLPSIGRPKSNRELIEVIGKALKKLSLNSEEKEAWGLIKGLMTNGDERVITPNSEINQIRQDIRELTTIITKIAKPTTNL